MGEGWAKHSRDAKRRDHAQRLHWEHDPEVRRRHQAVLVGWCERGKWIPDSKVWRGEEDAEGKRRRRDAALRRTLNS
jgi:hypothetical protein